MGAEAGLVIATFAGVASPWMVFHWETAKWFDTHFVEMELPNAHDVETTLEVGAWTWNYMEPVLGTASFMLLAAQFARSQMINLRLRPYTHSVKSRRADIVANGFPMLDKRLIRDYVMSS